MREVGMATLTVWKFDNPDTADQAVKVLEDLQDQRLIHGLDATTKPSTPSE
jgi:uncharacterized membrane protein